jgi:hypothetical protein
MRTTQVIVLTLLFICFGFTQLQAESETENKEISAALKWLSLIDSGNYSGSWNEASTYFKGAVTEERWVQLSVGVRTPLGKFLNRKVKKVNESSTLPGLPDGKYAVITFQTEFEHKRSTVETVTLMFENDSAWRSAGYWIN